MALILVCNILNETLLFVEIMGKQLYRYVEKNDELKYEVFYSS